MLTLFLVAILSTTSPEDPEEAALKTLVTFCEDRFDEGDRSGALLMVRAFLAQNDVLADPRGKLRAGLFDLIRRATKDSELDVRTQATRLVARYFETREAVPLLTALASRLKKELVKGAGKDDDENSERSFALIRHAKHLVDALGHHADAGSIKALKSLQGTPLRHLSADFVEQLAEAQLRHGTRSAFEAVIQWIPTIERFVMAASSSTRERSPAGLTRWLHPASGDTIVRVHELLHEAAERLVPELPVPMEQTPETWRDWLKQARSELPRKSVAPPWTEEG